MKSYYGGTEEFGRTLGLVPKLNYFALFRQSLKLGENIEDLRAWDKRQRERGDNCLARITASSVKNLADGLVIYAGNAEKVCTIRNDDNDECAVILENDGAESYLRLDDVMKLKRSGSNVIAVTPNGEKKCKTYVADSIEWDTDFIVRPYSQIPSDEWGYREGAIVDAWQQNNPRWRWSMHFHSHLTRDLNLDEQRSLAQRIETTLKERGEGNWKRSVKLVGKSTYPDIYEVVRDR